MVASFHCCPNPSERIRGMILGLDVPVELDNHRIAPAINLDNAATTPAFIQVAQEVMCQLQYYGSIGRGKGQKSEHSTEIYARGRDRIKDFVGANSDSYTAIYVGNTTDGMNTKEMKRVFHFEPADIESNPAAGKWNTQRLTLKALKEVLPNGRRATRHGKVWFLPPSLPGERRGDFPGIGVQVHAQDHIVVRKPDAFIVILYDPHRTSAAKARPVKSIAR